MCSDMLGGMVAGCKADSPVCVAIWLGTGARETVSKIISLWLPIFAFVFLGFEHVIV
jgi:formate/nitrite transporter FocA (FNT family)